MSNRDLLWNRLVEDVSTALGKGRRIICIDSRHGEAVLGPLPRFPGLYLKVFIGDDGRARARAAAEEGHVVAAGRAYTIHYDLSEAIAKAPHGLLLLSPLTNDGALSC